MSIEEALEFATRKHLGQFRADRVTPYVEHPKAVMAIVRDEFGVAEPEVLAAALLHDTIEDTTTDFDDLAERFGKRVASWVAVLTKDKRLPEARREREYFEGLKRGPLQAKFCKIADSLHNLRDSDERKRPKAVIKARKLLSIFKGVPALAKPLAILRAEMEKR
ncbi:MAG TPA: HD domain-containing protein [Solirubrobacterales bacterium]|nr:HD domain-containing protein [Solirubrobacterales bacterium]